MGSVVSGIFGGGDSSSDAAQAQERGTLAGVEEQRRQFDISQQQAAPFRQAGLSALQQQLALLGLPGLTQEQFGAGAAAGTTPTLGPSGEQLFRRAPVGRDVNRFVPAEQQQQAQPALGSELPPAVSREDALAAFSETPGQKFLRERQEKALLQNASAIGGLGGGNIRTALQEQAFGRSATQLGDFQNRLAGLSGSGQVATQNVAQLGGQTAGNISNLLQAGGQARASGILGAQQANAQLGGQVLSSGLGAAAGAGLFGAGAAGLAGGSAGAGALLGLLSDIRLKENVVKIGELPSGLNLYRWDWTEEGKNLAVNQMPIGVIAQEAQKLFPEAVEAGADGFLRVNYKELH